MFPVSATATLIGLSERVFAVNTAGEFVNQYRQITVPGLEVRGNEIFKSGTLTVSATAYVNTNSKAARTNPQVVTAGKRGSMRNMLLGLRENADLLEYVTFSEVGGAFNVSSGGRTLFSYTSNGIKQSFMGKGTPGQVTQAANLMNLWRVFVLDIQDRERSGRREITDKLTPKAAKREKASTTTYFHRFVARDLAAMVREFLGVDCNGFVNLYLKSKYPNLRIKSGHVMEDSYVMHAGLRHDKKRIADNLRQTVSEIQPDDAVVFFTGHYHHIAVVNTVFARADGHIVANLAESRGSSHGGVQVNTWTIRNKSGPKGPIAGEFLIDGRREDFVNIVSPQRWNVK